MPGKYFRQTLTMSPHQLFQLRHSIWLETLIFVGLVYILVMSLLLRTAFLAELLKDFSANADENAPPTRLLVELTDDSETAATNIDSFIISTQTRTGSGTLKHSEDNRTHLLGEFHPAPLNLTSTPAKASKAAENTSTEAAQFVITSPSEQDGFLQNSPPITPAEQPASATTHQQPLTSGLESENTTNFRFAIDNSTYHQAQLARDEAAKFFIELKKSLSYKLQLYADSPRGPRQLNYRLLKQDEVSALVTVDRTGTMRFLKLRTTSLTQPYLNYLITKISSHELAIHHFPPKFLESDQELIYLDISLSYKGPPLYQWWLSVTILHQQ